MTTLIVLLYFTVDIMMYSVGYTQSQDLGGSYLGPDINTVLRVQLSELERPDFTYISMFGREMNTEVCPLYTLG